MPSTASTQVDRKFIALRCGPLLVACDQHAADERVRLESMTAAVCAARGRRSSGSQAGSGSSGGGSGDGGNSCAGGSCAGAGRDAASLVWPDCAALDSVKLAQPQVR